MFTTIVREYFPSAIYLKHDLKFRKPVLLNEKVKAKMVVKEIRNSKKIVTFDTFIASNDSESGIAISGEAMFKIPTLKVTSKFYFRQKKKLSIMQPTKLKQVKEKRRLKMKQRIKLLENLLNCSMKFLIRLKKI